MFLLYVLSCQQLDLDQFQRPSCSLGKMLCADPTRRQNALRQTCQPLGYASFTMITHATLGVIIIIR